MNINSIVKKRLVIILFLVLIPIILFSNTLKNSFIWDDEVAIIENKYTKNLKYVPYVFTLKYWNTSTSWMKGQYRPIAALSFILDYFFWKRNVVGYHLTNLLLHILNVILAYFLACKLVIINDSIRDESRVKPPQYNYFNIPFLAALFFASHPIHTESVTWIKNRADLFASFFFLLSLLFFIQYTLNTPKEKRRIILYSLAFISFLLALLSKETALTLPLILVLYIICFFSKKEYKKYLVPILGFFIALLSCVIFKITALGIFVPTSGASVIRLDFYSHILIIVKTIGYYIRLLTFPFYLNAERSLNIANSFFEPAFFFSAILLLLFCSIIIKVFKYSKLFSFSLLWVIITLIPSSNIIFLATRPIAEQRLYIPSLGFCFALAIFLSKISSFKLDSGILRKFVFLFLIFILLFYSVVTIRRNSDWKDSLTFWLKTAKSSPLNPRVNYNLATAYRNAGNIKEAMFFYQKAIEINPAFAEAYNNLGLLYFEKLGKANEALILFNKAIGLKPSYPLAYYNRGKVYQDRGDLDKAISDYDKAIELDPGYALSYNNRGFAYQNKGDFQKAISDYSKAIELDPQLALAYYNRAYTYFLKKEYAESWRDINKFKLLLPNETPAFLEELKKALGREK